MEIKDFIPPLAIKLASRLRPQQYGWFGDYATWDDAVADSSGYDSDSILQKVKDASMKVKRGEAAFERDSVLFDKIEYSWPMLAGLLWTAARTHGELSVLDFGGSLGGTYFQNRRFFDGLKVQWNVVEQQQFVDFGNENMSDARLKFFMGLEECFEKQAPQVVLFSSVLQYLPKPFEMIEKVTRLNPAFIIVDNMPFLKQKKSRITVQKVDPLIYDASYPCWLLNKKSFVDSFRSYELIENFESNLFIRVDGERIPYEGFIFKATN